MGLDKLYVLFCCVERTPKVCTDLTGTYRDLSVHCSSPIKPAAHHSVVRSRPDIFILLLLLLLLLFHNVL
jgi:hypothetical protein